MKHEKTAVLIAFAFVLASFVFVVAEDTDATGGHTARVFLDDSRGDTVEYEGTGTTVKQIITNALDDNGIDIVFAGNGNVISVNGVEASDGEAWVVFQWLPPKGWKPTAGSTVDQDLVDGTSYYVYKATVTTEEGRTEYGIPVFEPQATAYFFIAMMEDFTAQIDLEMTECELREGFWIEGYGCDLAEAFSQACDVYGFTLEMNLTEGSELKGWLGNFMGLEDERNTSTDASVWKYWSQYYWDGYGWQYSQCLGHYDPSVTPYVSIVRQESADEEPEIPISVTPDDVPFDFIENGCTVEFYSGNELIETNNVEYFDRVNAPTDVSAPAGKVFSGWDVPLGSLMYVQKDMRVNAIFADSSLSITNKDAVGRISVGQTVDLEIDMKNIGSDSILFFESSKEAVATVNSDGRVLGIGNGTTTITVRCGTLIDSVVVEVFTPVESIVIDNARTSMFKGDSHGIECTVTPSSSSMPISFASSNTSVAIVDSSGVITATGKGEAIITATCGDKSDSFQLRVIDLESLTIRNEIEEMIIGEEHALDIVITPVEYDKPVAYSSSNTSVASVDQNGNIKAIGKGETTITATCGDKSDSFQLRVSAVKSIKIQNGIDEMTVGEEHAISVIVTPVDSGIPIVYSSSNSSVATVDQNGRIVALSSGNVAITATCDDKKDTIQLIVNAKVIDNDDPDIRIEVSGGDITATIENQGSEIPAVKVQSAINSALVEQGDITISVPAKNDRIVFEKESMILMASKGVAISITNGDAVVVYSKEVVSALSSGDVTFDIVLGIEGLSETQKSVVGGKPVIQLSVSVDGVSMTSIGGTAEVSMKYALEDGQVAEDVVVYHIDVDGRKTVMETSYKDGRAIFKTDHHSVFIIDVKEKEPSVPDDSGSPKGDNTLLIVVGVLIVILIVVAIFYIRTRMN